MDITFNSRDCEKVFEDLRNFTRMNDDGTTTEVVNNVEIYKGFKVIERDEITKNAHGMIIKREHRRFGVSTSRSADRAFRRAGLQPVDIESAQADLALIGAKDVLGIGSN